MNARVTFALPIGGKLVEFQIPDHARDIQCAGPATAKSIRDMVTEAVDHPLEFPELKRAILDDDLVAIAVEGGVPKAPQIVRALVDWLLTVVSKPEQITVVLGATDAPSLAAMERALLDHQGLRVVTHTPSDREHLEYIAAAESADAIYVQRDLVEASVVLPVYCIRHPEALHASDLYAISPTFADAETQHRWNLAWLDDNDHHLHLQQKLSREVGWLMGIQFALAVIPAEDGDIAGMVGGDPSAVHRAASTQLKASSSAEVSGPKADLVIASIDGGKDQQTWMNVARAVVRAEPLLAPAGRLVICCDVPHITDGIAQLESDEPDDVLERALLGGDLEDAFPAAVLRSVQSRRSVYLMTALDSGEIESLGLAHVATAHDLERLAQRAGTICLLRTSQF